MSTTKRTHRSLATFTLDVNTKTLVPDWKFALNNMPVLERIEKKLDDEQLNDIANGVVTGTWDITGQMAVVKMMIQATKRLFKDQDKPAGKEMAEMILHTFIEEMYDYIHPETNDHISGIQPIRFNNGFDDEQEPSHALLTDDGIDWNNVGFGIRDLINAGKKVTFSQSKVDQQ